MLETVHLGFSIPDGKPVAIPLNNHLAITGMTQLAGKTTCLDALIRRSGRRAITFITKRGEKAFEGARRIPVYFRERADWQFVESILEATMKQKMRFERSWIMRASRGARALADVDRNLVELLKTAKGMNADIYYQLHEYFKIVLPQIERLEYSRSIDIGPGLNVIDLSPYSSEVQALAIRSVLEWVGEKEHGVVVVIPEAWETLPEGRGSPVKLACEQIFRKGAGIGNFVWLDSQDIAGVWKEALRACYVWIMGVQGEIHEVKRMLAHLPTPNSLKPKPEQIMTLKRGHFYVRYGDKLQLVYVQPSWMAEETAVKIARGERISTEIAPKVVPLETRRPLLQDHWTKSEVDVDAQKEREYLDTIKRLEVKIEDLERRLRGVPPTPEPELNELKNPNIPIPVDALPQEVPVIALDVKRPEIEVTVRRYTIRMNEETTIGRLAAMIADGFFDEEQRMQDIYQEFRQRGWMAKVGRVIAISEDLKKLVEYGFLRPGGSATQPTYEVREGMKVRVKDSEVEV